MYVQKDYLYYIMYYVLVDCNLYRQYHVLDIYYTHLLHTSQTNILYNQYIYCIRNVEIY